jgi:hypothetical protein
MKYKISYLSNCNKVKITNELFLQFKKWEIEGVDISKSFSDELKLQDNEWINNTRRYYSHNTSFGNFDSYIATLNLHCINDLPSFTELVIHRETLSAISAILSQCAFTQRRRFLKHFYYGLSYEEIALQESVNRNTVRRSVKKIKALIKSMNIL